MLAVFIFEWGGRAVMWVGTNVDPLVAFREDIIDESRVDSHLVLFFAFRVSFSFFLPFLVDVLVFWDLERDLVCG
jgi:hypothetical protein